MGEVKRSAKLPLTPVKSSAITASHYDPQKQELRLQFPNGDVHRYFDVPEQKHVAFVHAESKGKFFNEQIRSHKSEKLEEKKQ